MARSRAAIARSAGGRSVSSSARSRIPGTWIMKNSSRLLLKMAKNFRRSSSGWAGFWASSSTRALNSSQLSSRLKKSSVGALTGCGCVRALEAARRGFAKGIVCDSPTDGAILSDIPCAPLLRQAGLMITTRPTHYAPLTGEACSLLYPAGFHDPAGQRGMRARGTDQPEGFRQIARRVADSPQVQARLGPRLLQRPIVQEEGFVPQADFRQIDSWLAVREGFQLGQDVGCREQARNVNIAAEEMVFHHAHVDIHARDPVQAVGVSLDHRRGHLRRDQRGRDGSRRALRQPPGNLLHPFQEQPHRPDAVLQLRELLIVSSAGNGLLGQEVPFIPQPGKMRAK